jgi:photosystem II stability/assembly factor-like uncharacterized protein
MISIFLLSGVLSYAQDNSQTSVGPAPYSTIKSEQSPLDNPFSATSRGFVYISGTSSHQFNKQFMGNVTVTPIGSPFTTAGWVGATARNTNTGVIYTNNQSSPFQIWSIDTTTGAATLIVSCTGIPHANFTGMVWDHTTNTMYGLSSDLTTSAIFTINMSTGVCTPVGSSSATCAGGIGLYCAPNGTLFTNDIVGDNLYKWNKTTGAATLVGSLGYLANYGQDGSFDLSDGKLYLASAGTDGNILRICDTTTGSASTVIGTYAGQPSCLTIVAGATGPVIPTGTWTEQTSGITTALQSVSAVDDNIAWACGVSGKVLRTTNKGVNWINASGNIPTANSLYNIYAWDANTAICVSSPSSGGSVTIYKTSNGGTNWITGFTLTASGAFGDDLYMSSATNAYYIGDPQGGNWHLLSSTNGGDNWSTWATLPTTNTNGTYNNAACFLGTQVWFCANGDSKINYTSNMGVNWSQQTISLTELTAICFVSPTRGLAGGSSSSQGLLSTTNGGTTWAAITNPVTGSISGIVGASTSWWVALQGTSIYTSSNDGANFSSAYTAPAGSFYHITKSRSGATIWGVRSNGGISRYGQPILGISPVATQSPVDFSLSQNYPNPFNPVTNINFALPKSGLVTLKVYNALGKEVATLVNEVKNAGTYNVDFNGTNLSSGVYFYRLTSGDFSSVKKMMLIK